MHIVEAWGTGLPRIINRCKEYGLPDPLFEEFGDGFKVTLFRRALSETEQGMDLGQKHGQIDQDMIDKIVEFCKAPKSANEIMQTFDLERSYFRRHYLYKLLEAGVLHRTEPDKPKSRNQKYYS
jgi:predicted HTH transcriptional regulator